MIKIALFLGVFLGAPTSFAASHSSQVRVSVEVVQSCHVDVSGAGNDVNLNILCHSAAKPVFKIENDSTGKQTLQVNF